MQVLEFTFFETTRLKSFLGACGGGEQHNLN